MPSLELPSTETANYQARQLVGPPPVGRASQFEEARPTPEFYEDRVPEFGFGIARLRNGAGECPGEKYACDIGLSTL